MPGQLQPPEGGCAAEQLNYAKSQVLSDSCCIVHPLQAGYLRACMQYEGILPLNASEPNPSYFNDSAVVFGMDASLRIIGVSLNPMGALVLRGEPELTGDTPS